MEQAAAERQGIADAFGRAQDWLDRQGKPQARRVLPLIEPEVPTFAEVPRASLDELPDDTDVVIVGAPYEGYIARDRQTVYAPGTVPLHHHDNYSRSGAWEAPNAIRQGSLFYSFGHSNGYLIERSIEIGGELGVVDVGNLDVHHADSGRVIHTISAATEHIASRGAVPMLLGGDHSISYPAVMGIAAATGKRIGVISMDAHLDLSWEPEFSHSSQWARLMEAGILQPENLVLVGSRGVRNNQAWVQAAKELDISYFSMAAIDERGIVDVIKEAVAKALTSADLVYLSIDIDVVDPASCPAQKYPDAGGLTSREIISAVQEATRDRLCGMDVCCLGPAYDVQSTGALLAARLILEGLSNLALARGSQT